MSNVVDFPVKPSVKELLDGALEDADTLIGYAGRCSGRVSVDGFGGLERRPSARLAQPHESGVKQ